MPDVQTTRPQAGSPDGTQSGNAAAGGVSSDWRAWFERNRQEVENALSSHLKTQENSIGTHSRLLAAVQYSVQTGGKRLRPILVLETCRACGGQCERALPAALAVEFVHTFSLIHDDLPAMDDDDLRRGQPTTHKVYGEALAILAGDWLVTHALGLLASEPVDRAGLPELLRALAGGTRRMIEGQAADIDGEGQTTDDQLVRFIHEHKTSALIETCCRLGAGCAGAPSGVVSALARYGRHLGLAFQIADDLLDARGTQERLGKRVGKDAAASKQTYPAAFGVAESEARAQREVEAALRALEPFGGQADRLRGLAHYVISRDH